MERKSTKVNQNGDERLNLYVNTEAQPSVENDQITVTLVGVSEILRRNQQRVMAQMEGRRLALGIVASDLIRLADRFARERAAPPVNELSA